LAYIFYRGYIFTIVNNELKNSTLGKVCLFEFLLMRLA